jgi:hypothetical protein
MTEKPASRDYEVLLWPGCLTLYNDYKTPEIAIIAGTGYGKTTFGTAFHFDRVTINRDTQYSIVTSNTHARLREANMPMFDQFLREKGFRDRPPFPDYTINWTYLDLKFRWGHSILMRSAQKESIRRLVSITAAHAWLDEPGLCDILASIEVTKRVRDPKSKVRQRLYTGTPEGINWFAEKFGDHEFEVDSTYIKADGSEGLIHRAPGRLKMHASTRDNMALPSQYVEDMLREFAWNENLVLAYIEGLFVPIYDFRGYDLDRKAHVRPVRIHNDRPLYVCWDFNVSQGRVGGVAWCTLQEDGPDLLCAAENKGTSRTTFEAVDNFIEQFPVDDWRTKEIIILGDAAGAGRDTRSYGHDYDIIEQKLKTAGYQWVSMQYPRANPSVALRIATVNRLFSPKYPKTLFINAKCNRVIASLEQTTIDDKGKIIKPSGQTHTDFSDAVGYGVVALRPIQKPWDSANYGFTWG